MSTDALAGAGGKFRKRPFRRAPATPYDRPPAAARLGLRAAAAGEGGRGAGWLARLVDPASRMIADGATRFFSSVFRKRLGPPPPQTSQEASLESREETHDDPVKTPVPNVHGEEEKAEPTFKRSSKNDVFSELEQLLNQKTFTRHEFESLTELLRSRTVGLSANSEDCRIEASTSKTDVLAVRDENRSVFEKETENWTSKMLSSTPSGLKLSSEAGLDSKERISSPTELAKAYMGSRSSKPALPFALHSTLQRETATSSSPQLLKPSGCPFTPKSSTRLVPIPGNGIKTPRSQGRSALYMMSRSPYFKAQNMASEKDHELPDDSFPRSQLIHSDLSSTGKQALKRRSSLLDSDLGSIGPIRRIRRKSNLEPFSKELIASASGRQLSPPAYGVQVSAKPTQSPASNSSKYKNAIEDADKQENGFSFIPHQSTQMAEKILDLVDKMAQSPMKKVSDITGIIEETPPKLTFEMLNKHALKSIKDIDSSKILNTHSNVKEDGSSESFHFKGFNKPASSIQLPEANGPRRLASTGTKERSESNGKNIVTASTSGTKTDMGKGSLAVMGPNVVSPIKRPAFKMQVPEIPLEFDGHNGMEDASCKMAGEKANIKVSSEKAELVSDGIFRKNSYVSPSIKSDSSLVSNKEENQKLQVTSKNNGFMFPVTTSESSSQGPPTPSIRPLFSEQALPQKEEPAALNSSSRSSSTATTSGDSSGLKFSLAPTSESLAPLSAAGTTGTIQESSTKVNETEKSSESLKPAAPLFPSITTSSASPVFTFGGSLNPGFSNGALKTSSTIAVSAASTSEPFENVVGSGMSSGTAAFSLPISFAAPTTMKFPTLPAVPASASALTTLATTVATGLPTFSTELKDLDTKSFKLRGLGSNASAEIPSTLSSSGASSTFSFGLKGPSPLPNSTPEQSFSLQPSQAATTAISTQSEGKMLSSSTPASGTANSMFSFGSSGFGSSSSASSFSFASAPSATQSSSMVFSASASTSGSSSSLSFASQAATGSSLFGSSNGSTFAATAPVASLFGSSSMSFPSAATGSSLFSSTTSQASPPIFTFTGSSSSQSTSPVFGSGVVPAVPSFGQSTAAPASPITFGASLSSVPFSFTMAAATATPTPVFGAQTPISFSSASPAQDQMNVEDSMTEDTTHAAMPATPPVFGQVSNPSMASGMNFGSTLQPGGFQFGVGQPTPVFQQAPSPFQAPGNLEFSAGGSFSLGSGGGDKSGRRIVKVRRDKLRKK